MRSSNEEHKKNGLSAGSPAWTRHLLHACAMAGSKGKREELLGVLRESTATAEEAPWSSAAVEY